MEHEGEAPHLTSVSAVGTGITDAELERQRSAANLADVASIVYTSGTTGRPKGCEITHGNFVRITRNVIPFLPELLMQPGARTLMFLPLAHVLARAVQVVSMTGGITMGHSAGASGLMDDLGAFKPTFLLAVPRIFEKVYAGAGHKAAMSGKGRLFAAASSTAVEYSTAADLASRGQGTGPGWTLRAKHAVFNKLLYPKVREVFGGAVGYTVSGASPLSLRENHFFHGAGVPVPRLRADRNHCPLHGQHTQHVPHRHRRHSTPRDHHPDSRRRRNPGEGHRRLQGLPQQPGRH